MIHNQSMADMFHLVNIERKKHSLDPYRWNARLGTVAYHHCLDMMNVGRLFHDSVTTGNVGDRLNNEHIPFTACGENCSYGNKKIWSLKSFDKRMLHQHQGLLQSTGHRKNLLSKDFRELGIAIIDDVKNSQGHLNAIYICQVFKL